MGMSHHEFLKFSESNNERKRVHFPPNEFVLFLRYVHMHEREKCTSLRSYSSRAVNIGVELNECK